MGNVDVIVGLQYGSEGKGKFAALLAPLYEGAVRVGAPNAGHTIIHEGVTYKMRQVPCAWVNPHCNLFIGAGGLISREVLDHELNQLPPEVAHRLFVDRNAGILIPDDMRREEDDKMNEFNGSTAEGVGPALARKVLRKGGTVAGTCIWGVVMPVVGRVDRLIWAILEDGGRIQLEGTQGYGLSLDHGPYPFCTSRNVLAASLLSDVGLAPSEVGNVYGVLRTYPIRVAGNSGPMGAEELTWAQVAQESGYSSLEERTTVTKRVRRVSRIDWDLLQDAVRANGCTGLFVAFADYLDARLAGLDTERARVEPTTPGMIDAMEKVDKFVEEAERRLGVEVKALSTGPNPEHTMFIDEKLEDSLKEAIA